MAEQKTSADWVRAVAAAVAGDAAILQKVAFDALGDIDRQLQQLQDDRSLVVRLSSRFPPANPAHTATALIRADENGSGENRDASGLTTVDKNRINQFIYDCLTNRPEMPREMIVDYVLGHFPDLPVARPKAVVGSMVYQAMRSSGRLRIE